MDRVLQNTQSDLLVALLDQNGAAVDATGLPTVTITRDDGTVVVTSAATVKVTPGTGIYKYTLSPAQAALLDVLTATWSAVINAATQTFTTRTQVVGGFVCSIPQIDASLNRGGTASSYTSDLKILARTIATEAFEKECSVAFTPRYQRQTFDGTGNKDLILPTPRVITIRSVSIAGVALAGSDLAAVDATDETGLVYYPAGWPTGRRNVQMTWEHGHRVPPADVSRAVALIASSILADGPFDDRGFAVSDQGATFRLLTAGIAGSAFSIPDVQAALYRHRYATVG